MAKKVTIILGGGGAKGSFQIGVLEKILEKGYDIQCIFGTSIGAFNGAFLAANQFEFLKNTWSKFNANNNFMTKPWIGSGLFGSGLSALIHGSLYNPKNIQDFLDKNLVTKNIANSKTVYGCTIVDVPTTSLENKVSIDKEVLENLTTYVRTSMSFTPGLPMVNIKGRLKIDGGLVDTIPVESSIPYSKDSDLIFIIPCNPVTNKKEKLDYKSNLINDFLYVFWEALWYEVARNDIEIGKLKYWKDEKFVLIQPDFQLLETGSFDKSDKIELMMSHGRTKAIEILSKIGE